MHLLSFLALAENPGGSAFNEMLRLFGVAAIVHAFFKGIKSLIPQTPAPPQTHAAQAAPTNASLPKPAAIAQAAAAGITPEILAVIAAAVATTRASSRRIVAIRSQSSHWEMAGRQSVLSSHRIR